MLMTQHRHSTSSLGDIKKSFYFRGGYTQFSHTEITQLQIDKEAYFSTTQADIAKDMTRMMAGLMPGKDLTVTDACASCGGNAMSLVASNAFKCVQMVEIDSERYAMLRNNVMMAKEKCNSRSETVFCRGPYAEFMNQLRQDIVFVDPPWGGPMYYKNRYIVLHLDVHLARLVCDLYNQNNGTRFVVFKAPKNFDMFDMRHQLRQNNEHFAAMEYAGVTLLKRYMKMDLWVVTFPRHS